MALERGLLFVKQIHSFVQISFSLHFQILWRNCPHCHPAHWLKKSKVRSRNEHLGILLGYQGRMMDCEYEPGYISLIVVSWTKTCQGYRRIPIYPLVLMSKRHCHPPTTQHCSSGASDWIQMLFKCFQVQKSHWEVRAQANANSVGLDGAWHL